MSAIPTYSAKQNEALTRIYQFLEQPDPGMMILGGSAGTGKSTLIRAVGMHCAKIRLAVSLAAPTGRAALIAAQKSGFPAETIHSMIYSFDHSELEEEEHGDSGEESDGLITRIVFHLKQGPEEPTLIIIDEASMVSDVANKEPFLVFGSGHVLADLLRFARVNQKDGCKVLFVGDPYQLPPVGMAYSPVFDENHLKQYGPIYDRVTLKEVFRQGEDSTIIKMANTLRDQIDVQSFIRIEAPTGPDLQLLRPQAVDERYLEQFEFPFQPKGNRVIHISATNKGVHGFNHTMRELVFQKFFGPKVMVHFPKHESGMYAPRSGEPLVSYMNTSPAPLEPLKDSSKIIFIRNGAMLVIKEVESEVESRVITLKRKKGDIKVQLRFREMVVELSGFDGNDYTYRLLVLDDFLYSTYPSISRDMYLALFVDFEVRFRQNHPEYIEELNNINAQRKKQNLKSIRLRDTEFFKEKRKRDPYVNALQVKFGYSLTCHKAQGGEWKQVFVNVSYFANIQSEQYYRWLYTAMTRASEKLFLSQAESWKPQMIWEVVPLRQGNLKPAPDICKEIHPPAVLPKSEEGSPLEKLKETMRASALKAGVAIRDIQELQWRLRFIFDPPLQIDLVYNGKWVVTSWQANPPNHPAVEAIQQGFNQVGQAPTPQTELAAVEPEFTNTLMKETFWPEFWEQWQAVMKAEGIACVGYREGSWHVALYLQRGHHIAKVLMYYDGSGAITKAIIEKADSVEWATQLAQLLDTRC